MTPGVVIFTDGSCRGNPGAGGWGALLMMGENEREIWGGEAHTTNNRMELMAAITALESLTRPCEILLHTDSQYVRNGVTSWMTKDDIWHLWLLLLLRQSRSWILLFQQFMLLLVL